MPGYGACAFPFDPDRAPALAPAYWSPSATGAVVIIDADTGFSLPPIPAVGHFCRSAPDGRHIVARTGHQTYRLWIRRRATRSPPAFHLPLDTAFDARLVATRQAQPWLAGGDEIGASDPSLSSFQAALLTLLLSLLDARAAGASLRELSRLAYPALPPLSASEFKTSSERRGTHRLVIEAQRLRDGGYRDLLAVG